MRLSPNLRFFSLEPMRSRYRIHEPDHAHFITATTVQWLPIFTSAAGCDIVVHSFEFCRQHKGLKICGWVILDNHLHAILAAPDLSGVLRDIKSFTAHRLIDQLQREDANGCSINCVIIAPLISRMPISSGRKARIRKRSRPIR